MTGHALTLQALGWIGCCVLLEIGAHVSFKVASNGARAVATGMSSGRQALWLGIVLGATEIVCWVVVLQQVPLTVAFPIMALTYVGIPMAGVFVLRERMAPRQIAGAALVAAGVLCVALSGM